MRSVQAARAPQSPRISPIEPELAYTEHTPRRKRLRDARVDKGKPARNKPISLELAARFLPLIAKKAPDDYHARAVRWLRRWLDETGAPTMEQAADVAGILANLPVDPRSIEVLRELS